MIGVIIGICCCLCILAVVCKGNSGDGGDEVHEEVVEEVVYDEGHEPMVVYDQQPTVIV